MKKFRVVVVESHRSILTVEAESKEKVEDAMGDGQYEVVETVFETMEDVVSIEEM